MELTSRGLILTAALNNVLGIGAARAAIMKDLRGVIEFDAAWFICQLPSSPSRPSLMTHCGTLMAITHHGINPIQLCRHRSFRSRKRLMDAAGVGEKDDCHSIAEKVMFGQMAPIGTGSFEVALDIDILKDAIVGGYDAV